MSKEGLMCVVSGFSGSGKGTIMEELTKRYDNYAVSISATTRNPRDGEKEGVSYFYKTKDEFEKLIAENALYEYNNYQGNYYGTLRTYVDDLRKKGKDVICEIDVNGAMHIREQFPDTVLIFVTPPSAEELKRRLVNRGTEEKEKINGRLRQAVEESRYMDRYDHILINDRLDTCVEDLNRILVMEHMRPSRQKDFIKSLQNDLKNLKLL